MLKAFVIDDKNGLTNLRSELRGKVECEEWDVAGVASTKPDELMILAHNSRLSPAKRKSVADAAENGSLVLVYTTGNEEVHWKGRLLYMRQEVLLDVLKRAPENFDRKGLLEVIDRTRKAMENRGVLIALAILSWCATFSSDDEVLKRRQEQYQSDRVKWLHVFQCVTREEFVKALGMVSQSQLSKEGGEVGRFVNWLWHEGSGNADQAPGFQQVLKELRTHFGMQVQL